MHPFKSLLAVLTLGLMPAVTMAADPAPAASALTDAQKAAVEAVVRELLLKKEPDLIIKAAQEMEARMEKESVAKSQEAINKNLDKLLNDPNSPVGGNPKGDVTVVQFFDYTCSFCKMAQLHLEKFIEEDKNVRLVYKEYPILGPAAEEVSKIALASVAQGKYQAFHTALMASKERPSGEGALKIAKEVGLDVEKLKKDMASDKIQKIIDDNRKIAEAMGARGTPTFIIGGKLYPGALQLEQFKKIAAELRGAKDAKK